MERSQGMCLAQTVQELLAGAVDEGVMPGAVAAVAVAEKKTSGKRIICSAGFTARDGGRKRVTGKTLFDLASLTKPLVTVPCVLYLVERGVMALDMALERLLPSSAVPEEKKNIQVWQLLSHCSGLPAHKPYFVDLLGIEEDQRKDRIVQRILTEPLIASPGSQNLYSDLGFMLLGHIIEQQTGWSLDRFYAENLLEPLGLADNLFFRPSGEKRDLGLCAATEVCPWTKKMLCGVVHDDNCRAMGGVAGHAGLFGDIEGVLELAIFLVEVWNGWRRTELFSRELLQKFFTRVSGSTWACGFDTPSREMSSSGTLFGPASVGHLGFTGTSIWMDLERGCIVVLLTNRVNPSRKNVKIRRFRPFFHDTVMERLLGWKNISPE